jgi:hypothetical protein
MTQMLTLGQAARLTGISRNRLSKDIREGRLAASRDGDWVFQIAPAALVAAYDLDADSPLRALASDATAHAATEGVGMQVFPSILEPDEGFDEPLARPAQAAAAPARYLPGLLGRFGAQLADRVSASWSRLSRR